MENSRIYLQCDQVDKILKNLKHFKGMNKFKNN